MSTTEVLFIQGASEGAHAADARLAASLARHLGAGYDVRYPQMPAEEEPKYAAWASALTNEVATAGSTFVLVGHSIGASLVLRYLALNTVAPEPVGVFLVSAPFVGGRGWSNAEFELPALAGENLRRMKMFFLPRGSRRDGAGDARGPVQASIPTCNDAPVSGAQSPTR